MFDAREFRRRVAAFATGVAIVTTTDGNGLRARAWRHSRAKYFAIHVLTADQREFSQRFSSTVADRFDGVGAVSGHGVFL
jgi:flavin reductase (DIM6/NTAB) family NADH-FMN oxidoreductase RutF